jgi:hypothetical protein
VKAGPSSQPVVTPTILEVMEHADLFGPFFKGTTWDAWKAVLAGLFGLDMDQDALALFCTLTGLLAPPAGPYTQGAFCVGRRGGKSRIMALIAVYLACFKDYAEHLAPGEVATVAIIAADRKQARSIFRYIEGMLSAVPALQAMVEDSKADIITLSNRVVIEVATASFRVTRGYSFAAVLCDEIAFWRSDDTSANPDSEILRALKPGMSSIPGSMLIIASSPYRKAGELYTTVKRNKGRDDARVLVVQAPTVLMNPKIDPKIIEEAYEEDPESAAAEYGAEFRSDIADFISREIVEACVEFGCFERAPQTHTRRQYFAFLDAAGGSGGDSMTLAISHADGEKAVLDAVRERRPPFSPDAVVEEFSAVLKSYGITSAQSDHWGGDWVLEAFRKKGITVSASAKVKSDIYRELLPLLNAGRVDLIDNARLVTQMVGLERRVSRSGKDSIDHAPGGHDDVGDARWIARRAQHERWRGSSAERWRVQLLSILSEPERFLSDGQDLSRNSTA